MNSSDIKDCNLTWLQVYALRLKQIKNNIFDLGRIGELYARKFLIKNHYFLVDSNWKSGFGEIDIIARKGDSLVFVEVKTRNAGFSALDAVDLEKQEKLIKLIDFYIERNLQKIKRLRIKNFRRDVIAISVLGRGWLKRKFEILHVEDAFWLPISLKFS